nr:MAG TPA: hypothetical protein [Caudoviricetes sp.]
MKFPRSIEYLSTRDVEKKYLLQGNGAYDGVIINNVVDYGSSVKTYSPHTVYECIDNS